MWTSGLLLFVTLCVFCVKQGWTSEEEYTDYFSNENNEKPFKNSPVEQCSVKTYCPEGHHCCSAATCCPDNIECCGDGLYCCSSETIPPQPSINAMRSNELQVEDNVH